MVATSETRGLLPVAAASWAGAAIWLSLGSMAVARSGSDVARFGVLPPIWVLPLLMMVCALAAWVARLSTSTSLPLLFSIVLALPWLPVPVPSAFLMWTGHMTAAVWVAVGVAMIAAHGVVPIRLAADPRRAPVLAFAIACPLFLATGFNLAGLIPGGDEPHYLVITQSLLKDGDLKIENNHARGDYREYFAGRLAPDFLRRGRDGQIYSIHAPGLPVVVAPAFALFGYRGVVIFLAIVAAFGTALLWRASYLLTGSISAAWFGWAAGALTVPFFFQSFAIYPDGFAATVVLFATLPLFRDFQSVSRGRWMAIGAALSALPWLHTRFAVLAGAIAAVHAWRLINTPEGRSKLPALAAAPALGALAWFAFFRLVYGTFNPSAPYGGDTQSAPVNILRGLPALFLDQQFGVLPYAPVYAVCVIGLFVLLRRRARLAVELMVVTLPYLLVTSMFYMWWAGSVSPARLLVPLLPLLAVPGAWAWHDARHSSSRAMAFALLCMSIAITLTLAVVDAGRLVYNFRDGYSLAAERLSALVDLPQGMPSFFRQSTAGAILRGGIWLSAMLMAWSMVRFVERRAGRHLRPVLAVATPVSIALAMMAALTVEWRLDQVAAATAETSQLALLSTYDPSRRPLAIEFDPFAVSSQGNLLSRIAIATPTRRPPPSRNTLLLAPGIVPAGEYELRRQESGPRTGTAQLIIGRRARPIRTWNLATDEHPTFELPVSVGSLLVEGKVDSEQGGALELVPLRISGARLTEGYARRAERYGPADVFFLDDGAFPEDPGFWIRGASGATVVVASSDRGTSIQLFLRNAPVKNTLVLDVDGRKETIDLQPREERVIPLPLSTSGHAPLVSFRTSAGFRPSEIEPGSTDGRFLGVWIEMRK